MVKRALLACALLALGLLTWGTLPTTTVTLYISNPDGTFPASVPMAYAKVTQTDSNDPAIVGTTWPGSYSSTTGAITWTLPKNSEVLFQVPSARVNGTYSLDAAAAYTLNAMLPVTPSTAPGWAAPLLPLLTVPAKGSLLGSTGSAYSFLAAGTNGHVLTLDSGEALGYKWAAAPTTPPAGSGSELQFRASASTFGAVTDSSVTGGAVQLGASPNYSTLSSSALGVYAGAVNPQGSTLSPAGLSFTNTGSSHFGQIIPPASLTALSTQWQLPDAAGTLALDGDYEPVGTCLRLDGSTEMLAPLKLSTALYSDRWWYIWPDGLNNNTLYLSAHFFTGDFDYLKVGNAGTVYINPTGAAPAVWQTVVSDGATLSSGLTMPALVLNAPTYRNISANVAAGTAQPNGLVILTHEDAGRTNTTGATAGVRIATTYNQASGDASNTDLLIDRTSTATGSGAQAFIDCKDDGTSYFKVSDVGAVTIQNGWGGFGGSQWWVGTYAGFNYWDASLRIAKNYPIKWTDTDYRADLTADVGLSRGAASRLRVTDGGTGLAWTQQAGALINAGGTVPGSEAAYNIALGYYGNDLTATSGFQLKWANATNDTGTVDAGLTRGGAAGLVKVTNGSTGDGALITGNLRLGTFTPGTYGGAINGDGGYIYYRNAYSASGGHYFQDKDGNGGDLITAGNYRMTSSGAFTWDVSTGYTGVPDSGVKRASAGVVAATDGTTPGAGSLLSAAFLVPFTVDATFQVGMVGEVDATHATCTGDCLEPATVGSDKPSGVYVGTGAATAHATTEYTFAVGGKAYVAMAEDAADVALNDIVYGASTGAGNIGYAQASATVAGSNHNAELGHALYAEAKYTISSLDDGNDLLTLGSAPGWSIGQPVIYWNSGDSTVTGLVDGGVYWLVTGTSGTSCALAATKGGAKLAISGGTFAAGAYLQRLVKCNIHWN